MCGYVTWRRRIRTVGIEGRGRGELGRWLIDVPDLEQAQPALIQEQQESEGGLSFNLPGIGRHDWRTEGGRPGPLAVHGKVDRGASAAASSGNECRLCLLA